MSTDTTELGGTGESEGPTATIGRMLESLRDSASVRAVYGEPIVAGDRTVVPVARVRYGFGGGYGESDAEAGSDGEREAGAESETGAAGGGGAGFGGGVDATPLGVVELDATGTRLVRFDDRPRRLAGLLLALAVGYVLGRRARG